MKRILTYLLAIALGISAASAQTKTTSDGGATVDDKVEFDKTVHDFGEVLTGSGPLSCTFTVKNISSESQVIYNVASSCGCTDVTWTRDEITPGQSGSITATYTNDEGPYPFSKTLTVYVSGLKKPVILRLRGTARSKILPLAESYPIHMGDLGVKDTLIAGGNMNQGSQRGDSFSVANLGKKTMTVSFTDISDGLSLSPEKQEIAPGATASFSYVVTSSRERWGKNTYMMTPTVNGKSVGSMAVWAFTKEDFSSWDKSARKSAAIPAFTNSTVNLGIIGRGTREVSFDFTNKGKSDLHIYKADADSPALSVSPIEDLAPGKTGTIKATLDTSDLPQGEFLIIITLTTNTPLRPLVNLFVSGAVE